MKNLFANRKLYFFYRFSHFRATKIILSYLILALHLFFNCSVTAQQNQNPATLPQITPPSPEAAAFARYGTIPVDYATGVPNISIPVYTIKSGQLEFPLSFSYHSSGFKVADVASASGLGWVFNGSGVITHTVLGGRPDSSVQRSHFQSSAAIESAIAAVESQYPSGLSQDRLNAFFNIATKLDEVLLQGYDSQSDRYTFNFSGHSGVFRDDYITGQRVMVPYYPIKITSLGNGGFKVVDENGTSYIFDQREESHTTYTTNFTYSYYLSSITSLDGLDVITFDYITSDSYIQQIPSQSLSWGTGVNGFQGANPVLGNYQSSFGQSITQVMHTSPLYLKKVTSKNSIVELIYDNVSRPDFNRKRLKEIQIHVRKNSESIPNHLLKKVKLFHSYFGTALLKNQRLKLDKIAFNNITDEEIEKYTFDYNSVVLPEYFDDETSNTNQGTKQTSTDYWGYYNGKINTYSFPQELFSGVDIQYALSTYKGNRTPDSYYMQACMLKTIHYPTGGKSEFSYKANSDNVGGLGGLRISSIANYSKDNSVASVKNYGYIGPYVRADAFTANSLYKFSTKRTYYADLSLPYGVVHHTTDWNTIIDSPLFSFEEILGQATFYNKVIETYGTATKNIGKTEYTYQYPEIDTNVPESTELIRLNDYDWGFITPLLKEQKEFKSGDENPVKTITNTYLKVKNQVIATGFKVFNQGTYLDLMDGTQMAVQAILTMPERYVKSCVFQDSKAFSERYNLINTHTIENFDDGSSIVSDVDYTYNDYLQLSSQTETITGKQYKTVYSYPLEFAGNAPYDWMNSLNYINPLIETTNYVDNIQTSKQFTQYKYHPTNKYKPEFVQTQKSATAPLETRLNFTSYDANGNVQELSNEDGIKTVYIWGYKNQLPIAKIENATYTEVSSAVNVSNLQTRSDIDFDRTIGYAGNEGLLRQGLDALRTSLPAAMVTTFTYDPLVGTTSVTDSKGYVTYYDYDSFGRLKCVKDADGNILSQNEYHYKGQQ